MKIAIVIDSIARGGAERQALNATLGLTRLGCDVELVYYRRDGLEYDHPALREAKVTYLPKDGKPIRFLWRLRRYLKDGGYDVVHGFKGVATLYAAVAGRVAGIPILLGGYRVEYRNPLLYRVLHRLANMVLTGWVVNARAIIDSMAGAIGCAPERFFVVYNGVDLGAFRSPLTAAQAKEKLSLDPNRPVVSKVAQLREQKNHRMFLEMAACVLKSRPDAQFLIVGDGALRAALEAYAASLGVSEAVRFLGDRSDIADILAATDVSVLTSHYEGLANALIEAMCAGVPVVSTDYAGVEELVTDERQGFVVPRGDAAAMARRVCQLLDDPALRQRMRQEGIRTAEQRFSIEAMAGSLRSVYETCLRRKSSQT